MRFSVSVYTLDREIFDARTFGLRLFLSFFSRRTVLIPTGNLAGGRARRVGAAPTEAIAWPGFAAVREKEEFYNKTPSRKKNFRQNNERRNAPLDEEERFASASETLACALQ